MSALLGIRGLAVLVLAWSSVTVAVAAQEVPPAVKVLTLKARLAGSVAAWCRAEFLPGQTGAYAVAVASPAGGQYFALESDGRATALGPFGSRADLSCYSRAEAGRLDATIRESTTIHGQIAPRWSTTVVCGFIDDTAAECWQYSPVDRAFVKVGQWIT